MPSPAASARLKPAAAAVTGTLIRKEKRAASSRLRPKNSPQLIVAPERETPGTRAAACASPGTEGPQRAELYGALRLGAHRLSYQEQRADKDEVDDHYPRRAYLRGEEVLEEEPD